MGKSKIEWTEVTWNPVLGCAKVSEGCRNCYAMTMSARIANAAREKENPSAIEKGYMEIVKKDGDGKYLPKWTGTVALIEERLLDPIKWQKPRMVFVNSMSDLFHPDVPFEFVDKVFSIMLASPKHTFQVLTKRPERMAEYLKRVLESALDSEIDMAVFDAWRGIYGGEYGEIPWPAPNVWLGTSVEDQKAADERIPHLLRCPAAVRFLSCEPLLGVVDLNQSFRLWRFNNTGNFHTGDIGNYIHWVIVGGESGHNARPMHPDWARQLRDQCVDAGVAFFFKQWGEWSPGSNNGKNEKLILKDGSVYRYPAPRELVMTCYSESEWNDQNPNVISNLGKKKAGRLLNGEEWNQMPTPK